MPWLACYSLLQYNDVNHEYEFVNRGTSDAERCFIGRSCCKNFIDAILDKRISSIYKIWYAHNAGHYDTYQILNAIC